jgi:hypothetical protein
LRPNPQDAATQDRNTPPVASAHKPCRVWRPHAADESPCGGRLAQGPDQGATPPATQKPTAPPHTGTAQGRGQIQAVGGRIRGRRGPHRPAAGGAAAAKVRPAGPDPARDSSRKRRRRGGPGRGGEGRRWRWEAAAGALPPATGPGATAAAAPRRWRRVAAPTPDLGLGSREPPEPQGVNPRLEARSRGHQQCRR